MSRSSVMRMNNSQTCRPVSAIRIGLPQALVSVFLVTLPLTAWSAPNAGSVLQQIEGRRPGSLPEPATSVRPALRLDQAPASAGGAQDSLEVRSFRFHGRTLLPESVLQAGLASFSGRSLTLAQLQQAAQVVSEIYRAAGWLAVVQLPRQEIQNGVVMLQVVEARLGKVQVQIDPQVRMETQRILAMVHAQVPEGSPIHIDRIDRALLLMRDLAGVTASGNFVPGQDDGTTDLVITLGGGKRVDGSFTLDNQGAATTGKQRTSVSLSFNSILWRGDVLDWTTVQSDGSSYMRAAWMVPVSANGIRTGLHASNMDYTLLGDLSNTQASGVARSWGWDVTWPWVRSPLRNVQVALSTDRKFLHNQRMGNGSLESVSRYTIDLLRASVSSSWQDRWFGTAQNSLSGTFTQGLVDLAGSPNQTGDELAANTQGRFRKFNLSVQRDQGLLTGVSWFAQAQAQSANRNLDSSEKLYLGGPFGVRAYPLNEAGGDIGYSLSTGLRYQPAAGWTLAGFLDSGRVQVYRHNIAASGQPLQALNRLSLRGHGLSLNWQGEPGLDLQATWSRRMGSNPLANANNGMDTDGTRMINRLWLSATARF